jgi:hypothetical protein
MGIGVVVQGYIAAPGWPPQPPSLRVYRLNKAVIQSLPTVDQDWPFIPRSMFALAPYGGKLERRAPQHEHMLIHFAASYKNMYALEAAWVHKFERILARLWWTEAVAYCEFSRIRYVWKSEWSAETFHHDPPILPTKWKLTCYKQEDKEMTTEAAIVGKYTPASKPLG